MFFFRKDWVCPHKRVLVGVINKSYDSVWLQQDPDWKKIRKTLKKELERTDFDY